MTSPERLSVRVGVGWNPFRRDAVGGALFWDTVGLLEELGYDSLWLSDIATHPSVAPLPMLAAVAAKTEQLKLGTSVLAVPARNPLVLTKELATIDVISAGRLFPAFGIGIALPAELAALGIPRDERVARLEECIEIIRALWTGEPVTYRGRFTTLDDVTLTPRPTRPKIEPWLGGSTPPAVKRIGRIADGWLASGVDPPKFASLLAILKAEAVSAGRAVPEDHFGTVVFVAGSADQAEALMAARRRAGRPTPPETIAVGVEQTRVLLERFREAGATKFVVYPLPDDPRPLLRALKTEVVDPFEAEPVYA